MASKSNLPTHSTWDQDDDQLETDTNLSLYLGTSQPIDQNDSYDESLLSEDDGNDDELYGLLQTAYSTDPILSSNTTTTVSTTVPALGLSTAFEDVSETLVTTSRPLSSPASKLVGVDFPQLHIHSSSQTDIPASTQQFTYPPPVQASLNTRGTRKRSSSPSALNSGTKRKIFTKIQNLKKSNTLQPSLTSLNSCNCKLAPSQAHKYSQSEPIILMIRCPTTIRKITKSGKTGPSSSSIPI